MRNVVAGVLSGVGVEFDLEHSLTIVSVPDS
jgi:phage shock protein PspC (stress-responsive transcriptional regulator)